MPFRSMKPLPPNPGLEQALIDAQRKWDAMSPEARKEMREAQRKSWVIGNFMLDHPEATREDAEEIYQKVVEGIGL